MLAGQRFESGIPRSVAASEGVVSAIPGLDESFGGRIGLVLGDERGAVRGSWAVLIVTGVGLGSGRWRGQCGFPWLLLEGLPLTRGYLEHVV